MRSRSSLQWDVLFHAESTQKRFRVCSLKRVETQFAVGLRPERRSKDRPVGLPLQDRVLVHALSSAWARSAQSASASSSPTLRRSRPGGTRSPSQRRRLSITLVTPPSEVAFTISRVDGLDAPRRLAVRDVEGDEAAEARVAHDRAPSDGAASRSAMIGRGLGLAPDAHLERLAGRGAGARRCRAPARSRCASGSGAARRGGSRPTTAPSSASSWPPRYFVALCSA